MVLWKAAKTIEGTEAERDALPVNSLEIGWRFTTLDNIADYIWDGTEWVELSAVPLEFPTISGEILHLDPALGITIETGVSAWADQSGVGNDVAQASTTKQPLQVSNGFNNFVTSI